MVLDQANVFKMKGIDPTTYEITFNNAKNVPAQGGLFGDCGIWACIFLYRLSHGKSLDVDNPVQAALAYREQMSRLFYQHRVYCSYGYCIQISGIRRVFNHRDVVYKIWQISGL